MIGDVLGIPNFKRVSMMKSVESIGNAVADNMAYSLKCTGQATLRSIITAESRIHERFIGPPNLIVMMAQRVNGEIKFGEPVTASQLLFNPSEKPVISTIPMPALMKLLDYKGIPEFSYVHGFNINVDLNNMNAYASVYVPSNDYAFNRVSATGHRLTIEYAAPGHAVDEVQKIVNEMPEAKINEQVRLAAQRIGIEVRTGNVLPTSQKFFVID